MISRFLYNRFGWFAPIRLIGRWKEAAYGGQSYPVSGLVYYLTPPSSLRAMFTDPLHGFLYILFILVTCALFSRTWIEVSGTSPKEVHSQLKNQRMTAFGGSDKLLYKKLKKYIPIAAAFGGVCIGVLTITADFLGAVGSGKNLSFKIFRNWNFVSLQYCFRSL